MREHVALADYTTIHLGGPARYFTECESMDDLREALSFAREHQLPVHILGGGSNSIFADEGFVGLVIAIRLQGITFEENGVVEAAAGEEWDHFVAKTIEQGLAGLECLSGIPGLVGATPIQNVGAYGQEVAEVIESVTALHRRTGEVTTFSNAECQFAYRSSRFKLADADTYIIASVRYTLRTDGVPTLRYPQLIETMQTIVGSNTSGKDALRHVRDAVLQLRRSKSMVIDEADKNSRSCGSFFVNPVISKKQLAALQQDYPDIPFFTSEETPHGSAATDWVDTHVKIPAAWLVEQAGFAKGFQEHGVGISERHPLALVNQGGTTAALLRLAATIQDKVENQFGVRLEREPVVVSPASAVQ